ncbi:MAG TPA: hypothetical protein VLC95_14170 [Anaerolineae bacterium]|nr:hypothetical protein [Anaerolineae bacterium]
MRPLDDVHDEMRGGPGAHWQRLVRGAGRLARGEAAGGGETVRFEVSGARAEVYSNAQLDDYQGLPRRHFPWRAPLRLVVRARFSHSVGELQGTAGFGFWNDPFLMTGPRVPALPRAAWFFHGSPPSNMKLALDVPGHGWKAATIDAAKPHALLWGLTMPVTVPLMNARALYRRLWPRIQRALRVGEALVEANATEWHTYVLEWGLIRARFWVIPDGAPQGAPLLDAPAPRGPLGCVIWMDNQFLVATPWGRFRWGMLDVPGEQWMEIDRVVIERAT